MSEKTYFDLGQVTAYAYAVEHGYTGTEEEFAIEQAQFAQNAQQVAEDRVVVREDRDYVDEVVESFTGTTAPEAVQRVTTEGDTQVARVQGVGNDAVQDVTDTKDQALQDIDDAGDSEVNDIQAEGNTQVGLVRTEGTTQVGNVNTAGTTQVSVVNQAGNTQVGLVQAEGTTQVQNVEDKGQEIIDALPPNYEEDMAQVEDFLENLVVVSDTQPESESNKLWIEDQAEEEIEVPTYEEFEAVSNAINANEAKVEAFYTARTICPAPWTQGRLSESTGENATSNTRCRTNSYTFGTVAKEITCAVPDGYKFAFFEYDSSSVFTGRYQWRSYTESGVVSVTQGYKYRFLIAKTDNSDIAPNDVPANALTITYNVNQVNTDIATLQNVDKLEKFVAIPNSNAGNGYISGNTGYRNNSDNSCYTDYIDVSGYSRIYYSRPGTSGSTMAAGMAFYDANKTFVSGRVGAKGQSQIGFIADIDYIDVPANAKYARFTKYISASYGTFYLYGVPKIVGELEKAKNGITVTRNSKADVLDMLSLAQSYLSKDLVYGYDTILQVSTETNQIDCSTFVGLCMRGYSYDETSYYTSDWVSPDAWVASPDHDWSVNPYDYTAPTTAELPNAPTPTFGVVRTASQIAQWMVERGQTVPMDEHLANLEPGDILFYARQDSNNEFVNPDRYEKINHCAICLTKELAPDSESWDKTKYPYKHTLIDARTRTGAIGIETVEDGQNDPTAVSANNINTLVLICRPDLTN